MAGDWIKVEQATIDKPEVLRLAELLGWERRQALGLLVEFWCWLDKNLSGSCPDFVRHMSKKSLDEMFHVPGFASALEMIGWGKFDDSRAELRVINADRHNGNTAKTRALDAKRKKDRRLENVREMSALQPDVSGTREEKRRVLKTNTRVPKKNLTALPENFSISDSVSAWAASKGFGDLPGHLEHFRRIAVAKDYRYANWDRAFERAIADDWAGLRRKQMAAVATGAHSQERASSAILEGRVAAGRAVPMPKEFQEQLAKFVRKAAALKPLST